MPSTPQIPLVTASTRVLPDLLDFHADKNPELPWAVYPASDTTTSSISFTELSKATHRIAHSIRPQGPDAGRDAVITLLHCDTIMYATMVMSICRAGLVPFPVSPRNSPQAITNLLIKTSCRRVITQTSLHHLLEDGQAVLAKDGIPLQVDELPELSFMYPGLVADGTTSAVNEELPYPMAKTHQETDIAIYMHSSGSTGLPKPIPITQKVLTQWIQAPFFAGSQKYDIRWAAMALPTFHTMGIMRHVLAPLVTASPAAVFEPKYPAPPVVPNPQNVVATAQLCSCNSIVTVPTFVELWAHSYPTVQYLASLKIVVVGGGPLSVENGDKLVAAGVNLVSAYGTTETGPVAHVFDGIFGSSPDLNAKTAQDWQWQTFPPSTKPRWVPQGDGTYELQFLTCDTHQPSVENIPDIPGYATADLFIPHPSKQGLWKIVGRRDDVIVLGSGEKIVPIPQERHLASHPLVADAVMFGRAKLQAGVLVDPPPQHLVDPNDMVAVSKYIDEIWPCIEQANAGAPAFARIFREMIILTESSRPLPRAAKGNVVRKLALDLYAEKIEHLYDTVQSNTSLVPDSGPHAWNTGAIVTWLLSLSATINNGVTIQPSTDIFEQGFDSLHATYMRNHIVNALRISDNEDVQAATTRIDQNIVYAYPIMTKLAEALASIVSVEHVSHHSSLQTKSMDEWVADYSANLIAPRTTGEVPRTDIVVFLTGSTGSLGSHILALLLANPTVSKVFTFNRPSQTQSDRHVASFEDRGLSTALLNGRKHVPLFGDLSHDDFDLPTEVLKDLGSHLTHVVHNAWRVDFNHPLDSFQAQIAGTRQLLNFCCALERPVRMLYTSSIGLAHSWPAQKGAVPESVLSDLTLSTGSGYSASKFVVEQMLNTAHCRGFEATSLRVGQVCGSTVSGAWNTTEWVPILFKSALALNCLPDLDGPVTWIPADVVAQVFIDLLLSPEKLPPVVNVVHPRPIAWKQVTNCLSEALRTPLPIVPFQLWLQQVEAFAENAQARDVERIPAIKLLGFFRKSTLQSPVSFDTTKAESLSRSIRTLEPLEEKDVEKWVEYWKKKHFL